MGKIRKNETGFSIIEGLLILGVIGILGFTGWFVYSAKHRTDKDLAVSTSKSPTVKKSATVSTDTKSTDTVNTATPSPSTKATTTNQPSPTTTPPTSSPTPAPTPQPSTSATAYEIYKISSDGTTAQESPVTTKLNATSVTLTVDLTCTGICQFKLVSDNYNLANTATYTSSQKITYTISTPGQYTFYNQYTPNTKFNISF